MHHPLHAEPVDGPLGPTNSQPSTITSQPEAVLLPAAVSTTGWIHRLLWYTRHASAAPLNTVSKALAPMLVTPGQNNVSRHS